MESIHLLLGVSLMFNFTNPMNKTFPIEYIRK